jgi:two-component system, NarL family, nitrate/nitrite response regulator NarL
VLNGTTCPREVTLELKSTLPFCKTSTPTESLERESGRQADSEDSKALTPREAQIALLVSEGLSNKLVARQLNIADATVKYHREFALGVVVDGGYRE